MKKRLFSFIMAVVLCCGFSLPAYATETSNNAVITRYVTSDGVLVRIYGDRPVTITEQSGVLIVDGKTSISLEDEPMSRGSSRPTRVHDLENGSFNQSGTISEDGYTYSDRLFYTSSENNYKPVFSGSASSSGGDRDEMYLFNIRVYDHMYDMVEMVSFIADVSLFGRISWEFIGSTEGEVSDGVCYFRYDHDVPASVSYDITVS